MSDPTAPQPDNNSHTAGTVWPPPPIESASPIDLPLAVVPGTMYGNIAEFQPQDVWTLFLFMVVTLGLYAPFWMLRTSKIINRVIPGRRIPSGIIWAYFAVYALENTLKIVGMAAAAPDANFYILLQTVVWSFIVFHYYLVFRFQSVLNEILEQTDPHMRRFNWLGTLVFGVLYLQMDLNKRIEELIIDAHGMQ